ncbi:MAG: hypothetical protein CBD97_01140 [Pelagibacteraceae bacterium TMED237]|nr:hypothetical protein [Candidatus Neomarinimicrobiota bacterium]OUW96671.1 MAG: hypothetical protein CBD97_01140 [Pelagibacteraceae bacterium TMED237]|tara:strand:- start:2246 stop:2785 length:540 start_codon:yes stop_codon:yes gene_type:complete
MIKIFLITLVTFNYVLSAPELVIGEERVEPGIIFIFEGAIKDHVMPMAMHLSEDQTNIHIEARVNWDTKNTPEGTPEGGFVPYLHMTAMVTNQKTGLKTFVDLVPHINLIDNFHYARNISLPGAVDDLYSVQFNILPPTHIDLSLHKDWLDNYGNELMNECKFSYKNVDFSEIAKSKRN